MEVLNHNIVNTKNDDTIVPCGGHLKFSTLEFNGHRFPKITFEGQMHKYMYTFFDLLLPSLNKQHFFHFKQEQS